MIECWNAHKKVEGLLDGDLKDYFVSDITMAWKTNHFILFIIDSFIVISQASIMFLKFIHIYLICFIC